MNTADPVPLPLKISRPAVPAPAEVRVEITTLGGCKVHVEGGLGQTLPTSKTDLVKGGQAERLRR